MKTNAKTLHAQARIGDRIIAHKIKQETARGSRPKLKTFAARIDSPVVDNAEQRPSGRAKAVAHRHNANDIDPSTLPEFTRADMPNGMPLREALPNTPRPSNGMPLYRPGGTEGPILPTSDDEAQMMTPPSTRDFIKRRGGK